MREREGGGEGSTTMVVAGKQRIGCDTKMQEGML